MDVPETLLYQRKCCVVCKIAFGPTTKKKTCARCQEKSGIACYCSTSCQRKHWPCHKIVCFDVKTTPIVYLQTELEASNSSKENDKKASTTPPLLGLGGGLVSSLQTAIDGATAGSVIILPEGRFKASRANVSKKRKKDSITDEDGVPKARERIVINKPIKILGDGIGRTMLECDFHVVGNTNKSTSPKTTASSLVVARLAVEGTIVIDIPPTKEYDDGVTFLAVRAVPHKSIPALSGTKFHIKCLPAYKTKKDYFQLVGCEIIGGADGLVIGNDVSRDAVVIIEETEISHAKYRGIFACAYFILKNSKIHSCGAYGIKGRVGWSEVGDRNEIQPGPWKADVSSY